MANISLILREPGSLYVEGKTSQYKEPIARNE